MILPEKSLHEVELNLLAVVAVGQSETIRCNLLPMDVADRLTLLLANSIKTWKFNSWQRPWDLHGQGCLCSSQESVINLFKHEVID